MTREAYQIRRAEHRDAEAIIIAHVSSIREVCAKDYTPEQIKAWAGRKFKANLWCQTMDRDLVWVVEVEGIVRGYGHLAIMGEGKAEVMGLYLAPEALGKGAGKELFKMILTEARKNGASDIELHSTLTAKTFYERQGFRQSAGDTTVEMQGVPIPCIPMKYCHLS